MNRGLGAQEKIHGWVDKLRYSEEFWYLDQMWWEQDRGVDQQYLDVPGFEVKKSLFMTSLDRLLRHAQIDQTVMQPHVERESELGLSKRAVFGIKVNIDRLNRKPSNQAIQQLREYVVKNQDNARQDFAGYEYDSQDVYGSAVNFIDFALAMRML